MSNLHISVLSLTLFSFGIFGSCYGGLGYTWLTRNTLTKRESDGSSGANQLDSQGKYTGGFNMDCHETLQVTPTRTVVQIDPEEDVIKIPNVTCHWNVIGADHCIPIMECKKFKLQPDVPDAIVPCENEHLEVTDGSGGFQRFCGDKGPKELTTTKGFRDLYVTFKGGPNVNLPGRGFKCSITCSALGAGTAKQLLEDNSEAELSEDCTCGRKPNGNRIVGGQDSKRGEFPWIVGLVTANTRRPYCGGTVINDKFIVTAAHCFKGPYQDKKNFQIVINARVLDLTGTGDPDKNYHNSTEELLKLAADDAADAAVRYNVDRYFIHPLYVRQTNDYDVALIKLKEPIDFKKHGAIIQPACIPRVATYNRTLENESAIVAGWGLNAANATSTMATLQKLDVKIFPMTDCKSFYNERISRRMMCAGFKEGGKDSCKGDSGGPLIWERWPQVWQLVGIVSWGEGCAGKAAPGVYQRVSELNQWIRYICNMENAIWCRGG